MTAAVLVIGDEILSGRTKDKNIGTIADHCTAIGIQLQEVRIVPDEEAEIVAAVNALRARYTYVFTTGGIGPTHDDITADCIAKAFGVGIDVDPRRAGAARGLLPAGAARELTPAGSGWRASPIGAELVDNKVSIAPGFMLGNVITMAGVPSIMQAMLEAVTPRLRTGRKMHVGDDRSRASRGRHRRDVRGPPEGVSRCRHGQLSLPAWRPAGDAAGAALHRPGSARRSAPKV